MDKELYDQYRMQEALTQQQLDGQKSLYAPQLQEAIQQNQAILVEQTNPKKVVRDIMLRLEGKEEQPDGTIKQVAEAKINDIGKDNIWFILDSHINQNTILSNLTDKEISKIIAQLGKDLVRDLSLNWKAYGIKKETDKDVINNSILVNIFLALKRAEHQGEKNWLGKISMENISSSARLPMPKKGGIFEKFRL